MSGAATITTVATVAAGVAGVASTVMGIMGSNAQADAAKQAAADRQQQLQQQEKAQQIQTAQQQATQIENQRQVIRQARVQQARTIAAATNSGDAYSSGIISSPGITNTNLGTSVSNSLGAGVAVGGISEANQSAAQYGFNAGMDQLNGQLSAQDYSIFGGIFNQIGSAATNPTVDKFVSSLFSGSNNSSNWGDWGPSSQGNLSFKW